MSNSDPLDEWCKLENENAKHEIVSAAYLGMLARAPQFEAFATWLLAGAGGTAALLVGNVEAISRALTPSGFSTSLYVLVSSALLGLLARLTTTIFPADANHQKQLRLDLAQAFVRHQAVREEIEQCAIKSGVPAPNDLQMQEIIDEFLRPMPWLVRVLVGIFLKGNSNERQADLHIALRGFFWLSTFCFLQALTFIAFLIVVAAFAYQR